MAGTTKEKFDAAVEVIHTLPKNAREILQAGSFVPSHTLMLKFYGFYKQATCGPCNIARPAFWDIIGKAKWDAWNSLGEMQSEEAMTSYVEELKKVLLEQRDMTIVEAMPHTDRVQNFVEKLGNFYELVDEMPPFASKLMKASYQQPTANGDSMTGRGALEDDLVRGMGDSGDSPGSPLRSETESDESTGDTDTLSSDHSPHDETEAILQRHNISVKVDIPRDTTSEDDELSGDAPKLNGSNGVNGVHLLGNNGRQPSDSDNDDTESDHDDEEFCDTTDLPDTTAQDPSLLGQDYGRLNRGGGDTQHGEGTSGGMRPSSSSASMGSQGRGRGSQQPVSQQLYQPLGGAGGAGGRDPSQLPPYKSDITEQIGVALVRLQQDMNSVLARLNTLETLTLAQHQNNGSRQTTANGENSQRNKRVAPWWWPFPRLNPRTVFFIVVWPFIVHWLIGVMARRRNRRR